MDPVEEQGASVLGARAPRGGLSLPRFALTPLDAADAAVPTAIVEHAAVAPCTGSHAHAHAHDHGHVPAQTPLTPTPTPAPIPRPAAAGHGHGHGHAHGHAHADGSACMGGHEKAAAPATHSRHAGASRAHAHAHAHSHAGGACDGAHGLFDAHQHDWSHLTLNARSRRMLALAFWVQLAFLLLEIGGGIATNSLALLGDAAHMLADVGALALAMLAARLAMRAADARRTWGMTRAEMLAAALNSGMLVISCGWIAIEAIRRAFNPESIHGTGVIAIALAGLAANLVTAAILARADRGNLNIKAAINHTLLDAASSVGVVIAGIVIAVGGPAVVDTVASVLIAAMSVKGTWPVLRAALDSLLDASPDGIDASSIVRVLGSAPGVRQVHDVHVWEPGPRRIAVTAHVLVAPGVDIGCAIIDLRRMLAEQLDVDHATLQVATDRTVEQHGIERVLLRNDAIDRAVDMIRGARPSLDHERIRSAVAARATHVSGDQATSPVRLAAGALRDLGTVIA